MAKKTAVMITNKAVNLSGIVEPIDENTFSIKWDNDDTETMSAVDFNALLEGNDDFEVDTVEIEETAASDTIRTHSSADVSPGSQGDGNPKTKMDHIRAILGNLATLDMTSLTKFADTLDTVRAASNATAGKSEANKASVKMHPSAAMESVIPTLQKDEQDAIFAESTLTEEAKAKFTTLFESAVTARLAEEVVKLQTTYDAKLQENVEEITASMLKQVNVYMNHVAKEYIAENKVAIQSKLRADLIANFMGNLHELMTKHYIDIPEDKVPVVEKLASHNDELNTKLNDALNENIELSKTIEELKRKEVISTVAEGLTLGQKEKFKKNTENVVAESADDFKAKVETIKEAILKEKAPVLSGLEDGIVNPENKEPTAPVVDERINYVASLLI